MTPYSRMGGEAGIRRFTQRFYTLMDTLPEAAACRAVHPPDLTHAGQRLFEYLSGWLGGPPLYVERHGSPMLRRRHLHAPIGAEEVRRWLLCFHRAWDEQVKDAALGHDVLPRIDKLARHMQNQ
ncbi:group II truncated hemoglobin [Roseococcus thiosulfatophilus]|uniref:group II truncated hemoglobin n=1 Tax=Roseococcus thiosulfatophilus TaxID=35813 RepID=UPI001A8DF5E1|nr:group II truncated hemoglobin [Roseococcus thiosulfatophilus]